MVTNKLKIEVNLYVFNCVWLNINQIGYLTDYKKNKMEQAILLFPSERFVFSLRNLEKPSRLIYV